MALITNLKRLIRRAKTSTAEELEVYRYILFFLIVADMFGVYYWFELKTIGLAIMIVIVMALAVVLLLEKNLPEDHNKKGGGKMTEEEKTEKKDDDSDDEKKEPGMLGDMGLPNPEEYEKRVSKAIGMEV